MNYAVAAFSANNNGSAMGVGSQVVDIGLDPVAERRRRRRAWLRIGLPLAGVVLMIATIIGIAYYTVRANREGALALSHDLLTTLEDRIALEVSAYLDPPARGVTLARDTLREGMLGKRLTELEPLAASLLREVPQIDGLDFGDDQGNFALVRRGEGEGTAMKLVHAAPEPRRVDWIYRDGAGAETGRQDNVRDDFDPRTRPWFKGALATDGMAWTGVYVFVTSHQPGITVSEQYRGADRRTYVYGADIALDALSRFLAGLTIGKTGRAVIIDRNGQLIAAPSGSLVQSTGGDASTTAHVDQLDDPVLTHAFDRFRVEGQGDRVIEVDGRRYITAVTPLAAAMRDWSVMLVAPEDEFVGFVASNNQRALMMSLVIVGVAVLLALLLIRQGIRGDQAAALLAERQRALNRQSAAFASLAADASLFDAARNEPPRALTETLADITGARRASVWHMAGGGRVLRCLDSFERDASGHTDGLELHRDELPQFFGHLLQGDEIEVADAARDRRTAELHRVLMNPLGTSALLAVPVRRDSHIVGAIWLEDAPGAAQSRDFIHAAANMLALRLAETPGAAATHERAEAAPAATASVGGERSFTADLRQHGVDPDQIAAETYAGVAVMVLHLTDPLAMAARASKGARSLSDEIACALQEIAGERDIPYLKIVGQDLIAAAGFEGAPAGTRIADAAMAVRERCVALFEDSDRAQEFRIGIDYGLAIGSTIGTAPSVFNLWGEAVRTAQSMAVSAAPGTVQATEAAYRQLRQAFLFRRRGSFYLPGIGEAQTFVLAGRL